MAVMTEPAEWLAETYDRAATPPSSALGIAGADGCGIGFHIGAGAEIGSPTAHDLGHAFRRHAQLRLRHAAIDAYMVRGDQAIAQNEPADAVDHQFLVLELLDSGNEPRQRPGIADTPVRHRIEKLPVILRSIAVKEVLQHVGDRRPPGMRTIDVVVIDAVFGEAFGQRLTVACGGGRAEARDEGCELGRAHAALVRSLRLIRHSAICTALSAAPLRRL